MFLYRKAYLIALLACFSAELKAEPGLFPVSNAKVPTGFTTSSQSIFNIIPLARNARIVAAADYDAEVEKRANDGVYGDLIVADIEHCRATKQASCSIVYKGSGTAFLAGDEQTLWSVRHNFDPQIQERVAELPSSMSVIEQQKAILETSPGFLLFDSAGKKLFDTREKGDFAKFSFVGNPKLVDYDLKQGSDVAVLSLSRSLGRKALTISDSLPPAQDQIYIVGFPTKTMQRVEKHGAIDADGAGLRVSIGKNILASEGFFAAMARANGGALAPEVASMLDSMFLFFDADGVPGQSGAPLLDSQGQIVGIFSSHCIAEGARAPEDAYCEHGGFGPHIKWIKNIKTEYASLLEASN